MMADTLKVAATYSLNDMLSTLRLNLWPTLGIEAFEDPL